MSRLPWMGGGAIGGVILGLLLGFVMWAGDSRPQQPAIATTQFEPVSNDTPPRPAPQPTQESPAAQPVPPAPREVAAPEQPEAPVPDIPVVARGDGVLEGEVKTEDGAPLPDFTFGLRPVRYPYEINVHVLPLEGRIDYETRRHHWLEAATMTATTDARGYFRFEGLVREPALMPYTLANMPEGYRLSIESGGEWHQLRAGQFLSLRARRSHDVELRVYEDGQLAQEARYNLRHADTVVPPGRQLGGQSWTRQSPRITVSPGPHVITVWGARDPHARAEKAIEIPESGLDRPIVVHLARPRGIYVEVHEPDGYIGFNVRGQQGFYECFAVAAERYSDDLDYMGLFRLGHRMGYGRTFAHPDPAPGRYVIVVVPAHQFHGGPRLTREVEIADESVQVDIHLEPMAEEDFIVVRVHGPDDLPVTRDVVIQFRLSSFDMREVTGIAEMSNRQKGEWWLNRESIIGHTRMHNFPETPAQHPHHIELTVIHPRYGRQVVAAPFNRQSPIEVRFQEPAKLEVHVSGMTDENRRHLVLVVVPKGGSIGDALSEAVEPVPGQPLGLHGDTQTLSPVAPGPSVVVLGWRTSLESDQGCVIMDRRDITLMPGDNRVSLSVGPLHSLAVTPGRHEVKAIWLHMLGAPETGMRLELEDGKWRAERLPAGDYELRVWGQGSMRVRVPAASEIILNLEPVNGWHVVSMDRQGIAVSRGLRFGDYVSSINGERGAGTEALQEVLNAALETSNLYLTIERDGRTLNVTMSAEDYRKAFAGGLRLAHRRLP
jgi:hypothetical protein